MSTTTPNIFKVTQWTVVIILLSGWYGILHQMYDRSYSEMSHIPKYNISVELFKRLLVSESLDTIEAYEEAIHNNNQHILTDGFAAASTDQRVLWEVYLACLKMIVGDFPTSANFVLCVLMLLTSLCLLVRVFGLTLTPGKLLLLGLLPSPYILYHCYMWEPHILQAFLTSLSVYCYWKTHIRKSFMFMSFSVFAHPGNLPFLLVLLIFHAVKSRKCLRNFLPALTGACCGWLMMELLLLYIYSLDTKNLMPHVLNLVNILFISNRTSEFARSPGFLLYLRVTLTYLPLSLIGMFWVRSRFQAVLCFGPFVFYYIFARFTLPGAERIMLPVYIIGFAAFMAYWLELPSRKRLALSIIPAVCILINLACTLIGFQATDLRREGPISLSIQNDVTGSGYSPSAAHWNLRRFGPVSKNSEVVTELFMSGSSSFPTIPYPKFIYHYIFRRIGLFLGKEEYFVRGNRVDIRLRKSDLVPEARSLPKVIQKEVIP